MTTTLPPSGDTPAELAEHLASGARLVEAFHLMPGVARAMREAARLLRKPCTCHPDDNPPVPCPRKYALSECRAAAPPAVQAEPVTLERWGMKSPSTWPFFEKVDDGYWTPWHIANEALQRAAPPAVNPAPGYCPHCKQYTIAEPLPADDEAVRLLREARGQLGDCSLKNRIDAYLAKANVGVQPLP